MPAVPATAFLVEYTDGTRGTILLLNGHIQDFCFAARIKGESKPASCLFYLPPPPGADFFDALVSNIEKFFETGKSPYPVERTLLTTGPGSGHGEPPSPRRPCRDAGLEHSLRRPGRQRLFERRRVGPRMMLLRRCLVLAVLLFWLGGTTFYAGVVVPVGARCCGRRGSRPSSPGR